MDEKAVGIKSHDTVPLRPVDFYEYYADTPTPPPPHGLRGIARHKGLK